MNALIDLLPLALFGAAYFLRDIYTATAVLIGACFAVAIYHWVRTRRLPRMPLFTALLAAVFGGLTIYLHDPDFIKLKFSLVYLLFGALLLGSHFVGDKVLLARIPQDAIKLPEAMWRRLNLAWVVYFLLLAAVNLYIARNFSEAFWVKFKLACVFLPVVFMLMQAPFLAPYLESDPESDHAR